VARAASTDSLFEKPDEVKPGTEGFNRTELERELLELGRNADAFHDYSRRKLIEQQIALDETIREKGVVVQKMLAEARRAEAAEKRVDEAEAELARLKPRCQQAERRAQELESVHARLGEDAKHLDALTSDLSTFAKNISRLTEAS
jgi:hypothetical protein